MGNAILFLILAVIAIGAAILMLVSKNAVHSALYLILNFAVIAVYYILLNAPFLAMVQITVYAGAIMVLFLFVIMLLGAEESSGVLGTRRGQLTTALLLGAVLIGSFVAALGQIGGSAASSSVADTTPRNLAIILFESYVFPFEVTGVLLLVAVVGLYVMSSRLVKKD
ncbi:MAG: NADH-quinone oxidoreductase subunit J [Ardenticatenaceae bacterium]|nr:NADH-quinone oxidoreductase subunit J [Ardenticatenaceae bacterium]